MNLGGSARDMRHVQSKAIKKKIAYTINIPVDPDHLPAILQRRWSECRAGGHRLDTKGDHTATARVVAVRSCALCKKKRIHCLGWR